MITLDSETFNSGSTQGSDEGQLLSNSPMLLRREEFEGFAVGDRVIVLPDNGYDFRELGDPPTQTPMAGYFGRVTRLGNCFVMVEFCGSTNPDSDLRYVDGEEWHMIPSELAHAD